MTKPFASRTVLASLGWTALCLCFGPAAVLYVSIALVSWFAGYGAGTRGELEENENADHADHR